jgi:hypothetical protein
MSGAGQLRSLSRLRGRHRRPTAAVLKKGTPMRSIGYGWGCFNAHRSQLREPPPAASRRPPPQAGEVRTPAAHLRAICTKIRKSSPSRANALPTGGASSAHDEKHRCTHSWPAVRKHATNPSCYLLHPGAVDRAQHCSGVPAGLRMYILTQLPGPRVRAFFGWSAWAPAGVRGDLARSTPGLAHLRLCVFQIPPTPGRTRPRWSPPWLNRIPIIP